MIILRLNKIKIIKWRYIETKLRVNEYVKKESIDFNDVGFLE